MACDWHRGHDENGKNCIIYNLRSTLQRNHPETRKTPERTPPQITKRMPPTGSRTLPKPRKPERKPNKNSHPRSLPEPGNPKHHQRTHQPDTRKHHSHPQKTMKLFNNISENTPGQDLYVYTYKPKINQNYFTRIFA